MPDSAGASTAASTAMAGTPAPAAQPATPPAVTPETFRTLRWIEGTWKGSGGRYAAFFERYEFTDDSTIAISHFADSTLGGRTDGGRVELRGGTVRNVSSGPGWVAVVMDSTSIRFEPAEGSGGGFTWRRESASGWTAALHSARGDTSVVYRMQRMNASGAR